MKTYSRRDFMRSTGAAATAAIAASSISATSRAEQSRRIRHAVIGLGSQGRLHARTFDSFEDCELVAICDVDPRRRERARNELDAPASLRLIEDFRTVLSDPDIDSISIATPDHWHTPIALHALGAGKHVYVEKPCCHNIHEGRLLLKAATTSGKCVQHGTQSRSGQGIARAVQFLRSGELGKVRMAKAINHQLRESVGRTPEEDPPPGVNYDLWLGPAPAHRFTKNRWHYNWHWFWDYGCGDIGNDGIHQIDVARWGLGVALPKVVTASGGQLFYDDDHETPDTQIVTFEYDECYLLFEMRLWTDYPLEGHDNGTVFYADKGTLEVGRRGCEVTFNGEPKKKIGGGGDFGGNVRNFLDAAKANDPALLNAPIDEGVISSTLCHLGNIATRVGRTIHFDAENFVCVDDSEADALISRAYRKGYELPRG